MKIVSFILKSILFGSLILILTAGLLSGCGSKNADTSSGTAVGIPGDTAAAEYSETAAEPSGTAAEESAEPKAPAEGDTQNRTAPADSYANFRALRDAAIVRMRDAKAQTDNYVQQVFGLMTEMDGIWGILDALNGQSPTEVGAKSNILIKADGSDYTVSYLEEGSFDATLACSFDKETDSFTGTIDYYQETLLNFEYTKSGSGYAAQYWYTTDGTNYQRVFLYFDDANISAFGVAIVEGNPGSCLTGGPYSEEMVKNETCYMILKDGKYESMLNR